jgi:L-alanine-DL-glutamate epimerase-like enolase superfamily enzyme
MSPIMKIEDVDFFYLAMPEIQDIGDGSQDTLLVRVRADGLTGWGECEASPLVSIANWVTPMSHSACKALRDLVTGQTVDCPGDIVRLSTRVNAGGLDIAQTDHTFSGLEIALWDLLGKREKLPVYRLLGYDRAYPKTPYASQLFGDTPEATFEKARVSREQGYRAVKFGWGNYGRLTPEHDRDQVAAARKGLGDDGILMIDAGTVWVDDVEQAKARLPALADNNVHWLEEPFVGDALSAYRELAEASDGVRIAGGEGAFNVYMARNLVEYGKIDFVQIDTGRIGGIGPSKSVAEYASEVGIEFVNHTFTTHLALSASLAPFVGIEKWNICEFPVEATPLATELYNDELARGDDGLVRVPESPGLGVEPNIETIRRYLVDVEINVAGRTIYSTPDPS